ncbi:MAG: NAD-dependent epimerase/dehydratase family protein [Gammaproteobacteria bacterium]|nr:MAG: NAD-dependent epimerase/dehydratase family protein [Gammaproteobacteria bacterium]
MQKSQLVAVTGATGFIGCRLLQRLGEAGHRIRALTRRPMAAAEGVEWLLTALDDPAGLDRLLADADALIHCAGAVRGARYADFEGVNVIGTAAVAEAARRCPTKPRILLLSSLTAREPQLSHYARSKRAAEQILEATDDLQWSAYRAPAVYGPGDKELRPTLDGMRRGLATVPGHAGRFSLIYVDDLVDAMLGWLGAPAASGVFELDDGMPGGYNWDEVIGVVSALFGRRIVKLPLPHGLMLIPGYANLVLGWLTPRAPMLTPGKLRELFHEDWVVRDQRLKPLLGWQPCIGLADGLARTFAAQ